MTYRKAPFALVCVVASLLMQACVQYYPEAAYPPPPQPPPYPAQAPAPAGAMSAVEELVAPIALYPDPLLAIILPASTAPSDITAAAAYLVQYGDPSRIDSQPWDPSVRALAHYPMVIAWMAQNLDWTAALGSEFASSPAEVMDAVQRLRARARTAGTLVSTPQQEVLSDGSEIEIIPAQPDAVYVPEYDPGVVYSDDPYNGYGPAIYFGEPFLPGIWLDYSLDWRGRRVWAGDRDGWRDHGRWHAAHFDGDRAPAGAHRWHPRQGAPQSVQAGGINRGRAVAAPRPMQGAPRPQATQDRARGPRPGQAQSAPTPVHPAPSASAPPRERPRLGPPAAPAAPKGPERPPTRPPAGVPQRPGVNEQHAAAPQSPAGAARTAPGPAAHQAAAPPARGAHAPAAAPARAQRSAPAAAAPAPSSSSGTKQPQN
jgi:hypothetical protein